ncbi:LamG domain-containing protein [Streptomyces winkii]|uniref:family 16 glycosylhydrolase n=1 Tax=Streptomyces winkii TaxID=3051178 RepID=UPI0028D1118A|nr:family 16 glycosylhydrolase [Streptomyces sp. DSM 40971]
MADHVPGLLDRLRQRLQPVPSGAGRTLPASPSVPRGDLVFVADFSSTWQWEAGRSWAYPDGGPTNPGDNKLDHLVADPSYSRGGVFRATRRDGGLWSAGLLTTEGSREGFTVRTGDLLQARVRLPEEVGAWPAIWTWRDGGSEIDVFEYHPDNPGVLELSNHVRGSGHEFRDPAVRPGAWADVSVEFGADCVTWWINGAHAFSDGAGVGDDWSAYLIVNLSVSAGAYHPAPPPTTHSVSYEVGGLRVYRP